MFKLYGNGIVVNMQPKKITFDEFVFTITLQVNTQLKLIATYH